MLVVKVVGWRKHLEAHWRWGHLNWHKWWGYHGVVVDMNVVDEGLCPVMMLTRQRWTIHGELWDVGVAV